MHLISWMFQFSKKSYFFYYKDNIKYKEDWNNKSKKEKDNNQKDIFKVWGEGGGGGIGGGKGVGEGGWGDTWEG